mgnify:CR=1 FL=1
MALPQPWHLCGQSTGGAIVVDHVLNHGENSPAQGQLVPERDAQALADAMLFFLADQAATTAAGTQCRERVCRQFSEQAMVAQYLALYREINQ